MPAKILQSKAFWLISLIFCVGPQALGQPPAAPAQPEPTTIEVMIQVLLSENTDLALRENQARTLIQDPKAYPALADILTQDANLTAKTILCKTVAASLSPYATSLTQPEITPKFVDAIFACVFSENPDLAWWASLAISGCHNSNAGERLTAIAADHHQPNAKRLAAVDALKLIPDKASALALGALLDDPDPDVNQRAAEGLAVILGRETPPGNEEFKVLYLDSICNMSDDEFLRRQISVHQKIIADALQRFVRQKEQADLWQKKYLDVIGSEFDRLPNDQEKLNFLTRYLGKDNNAAIKAWAAQKIVDWVTAAAVQTGPVAEPLVQLLAQHIHNPDDRVRLSVSLALAKLIDKAQSLAPELMSQLKQETIPQNQAALLDVLSMFDGQTLLFEQALTLLDSPHPVVVAPAARAIKNICASPTTSLSDGQVGDIAQKIAKTYQKWEHSVEIRQELILAMRPIAAKEKYRNIALTHFNAPLLAALDDPEENLRSAAVRTLTELHHYQILPILLDRKRLLDDASPAVRFAVIDAIRDYGSADQLSPLQLRFQQEQNPDVAKAIRDVFLKILSAMTIHDIYQWADALEKSPNRQLIPLADQAVLALWDKIAKSSGQEIPLDQKRYTLERLASIARRDRQTPDVVKWYQTLIALDGSAKQKAAYHIALIQSVVSDDGQPAMFDAANASLAALTAADLNTATQTIRQIIDNLNLADPAQLIHAARILAGVIIPTMLRLPADEATAWRARCTQTALRLIENQSQLLTQSGAENPVAIQLLTKLDARLNNFPANQTVEVKQQTLEKYRRVLEPPVEVKPKSQADAPPAAAPSPAPNTTAQPPAATSATTDLKSQPQAGANENPPAGSQPKP